MNELIVELRGRLGNQLFLWASGLGISRATGANLRFWNRAPEDELVLPELIGSAYREVDPRHLWKFGFLDRPPRPADGRVELVPSIEAEMLRRLGARWYGKVRRGVPWARPGVVEIGPPGRYRSELMSTQAPMLILDWLQSERYFSEIADEIVATLHLPAGEPALPADVERPAIAVSFRRGDYNLLSVALPLAFYEQALALVAERVGADRGTLVVFADDEAFAQLATRWLEGAGHRAIDAWTVARDAVGQLRGMAECDHFVIANSSFAWWGAWLGEQRSTGAALVVAPAEYASGGDRIPSRWISLKSGVDADTV